MRRIRFTLSYDGSGYHGWQVQPRLTTIQGLLQQVLTEIEGHPVAVAGSGRTDAGVHALAQVAACSLANLIPVDNLRRAMNRLLPPAIRILTVEEAAPDFHPRHQAVSKTYEYRIFRAEICPPFICRWVYHHPYPLAESRMLECAPLLDGEHDFSAFAASDDSDALGHSKVRTIFSSRFERRPDHLVYRVRGNGFLKHMVRNIVGTFLEVGKGNLGETELRQYLNTGEKAKAGPTAPPNGLFLVCVEY